MALTFEDRQRIREARDARKRSLLGNAKETQPGARSWKPIANPAFGEPVVPPRLRRPRWRHRSRAA